VEIYKKDDVTIGQRRGGGHKADLKFDFTVEDLLKQNHLVIKRSLRIGDLLMLQPALRELRKQYEGKITLETSKQYFPLYKYCEFIDELTTKHTGGHLVDLDDYVERHKDRLIVNRIDLFGLGLGLHVSNKETELVANAQDITYIRNCIKDCFLGRDYPVIVVALKSVCANRTWDGTIELVQKLEQEYNVIVVDTEKQDLPIDPKSNWTGQLTLELLIALVESADLVITPDTGTLHIAAALKIPFIALYTQEDADSADPDLRCRYYKHYSILKSEELTVNNAYCKVRGFMNGERLGRELVCNESLTIHRGKCSYKFIAGIPLWVPEEDAIELLRRDTFNEPEFPVSDEKSIVWIVPNLGLGGAELHTLSLLKSFSNHKWKHHVIVTRTQGNDIFINDFRQCAKVRFASENSPSSLRTAVAQANPDLIVYIYSRDKDAEIRRMFSDIPTICIVHTSLQTPKLDNTFYVFTSNVARSMSTVSEDFVIIPNGVDTKYWHEGDDVRSRMGLNSTEFVALYVGRLSSEKRVTNLIEACNILGVKLIIAGDGPDKHLLEATVRQWGMEDKVDFRGYVPQRGIRNLLKSCDCLVLPSRTESMPLVILEGMAAEIPIITTEAGDSSDVLGPAGYIYNSGNVQELAACMYDIINDPRTAELKARDARHRVMIDYRIEDMFAKYHVVFGDKLGEPVVHVGIIAYGGNIGKTVQSVLDSDYSNFYVTIVGEGLKEEGKRWENIDCRVKSYLQSGQADKVECINYFLEESIGEWLILLEEGNTIPKDRLSSLKDKEESIIVYSWNTKTGDKSLMDENTIIPLGAVSMRQDVVRGNNIKENKIFYGFSDLMLSLDGGVLDSDVKVFGIVEELDTPRLNYMKAVELNEDDQEIGGDLDEY